MAAEKKSIVVGVDIVVEVDADLTDDEITAEARTQLRDAVEGGAQIWVSGPNDPGTAPASKGRHGG
jgi:hypothetical protein